MGIRSVARRIKRLLKLGRDHLRFYVRQKPPLGPIQAVVGQVTSPYRVVFDRPTQLALREAIETFHGWVLHPESDSGFTFSINSEVVPTAWYKRPDLDARVSTAFSFFLDVLQEGQGSELDLVLQTADGRTIWNDKVKVAPSATQAALHLRNRRIWKQERLQAAFDRQLKHIPGCKALSALPEDWSVSPRLSDKMDPTSAHAYGPSIQEFIAGLGDEAFILDAGAGLRRTPHPQVVNMEIYDYPSTDVLAIGQDLPFKTGAFDGVISSAVLEHVDDPFRCASELIRVTKPGGKIYVAIPFLQAEHGYPSHFFNATRFGVRKLFEDGCVLERQWLGRDNHPMFTVHQILGIYRHGLPDELRDRFDNLTVHRLLEIGRDMHSGKGNDFMPLQGETAFQIAWGTTNIFQRSSA